MEHILFSSCDSLPEVSTISKINSLNLKNHGFILILGASDSLQQKFYEKSIKSDFERESTKVTKTKSGISSKQNISSISKGSPLKVEAKIYIEEFKEDKNIIWCITEDLTESNFQSKRNFLKNIANYTSKILFFINFETINHLNIYENLLIELISSNNKDQYNRNVDWVISIDITNSTSRTIEKIESNCFNKLKKIKQIKLIYTNIDNYDNNDDLELRNLFRETKNSAIENISSIDWKKFLSNYEQLGLSSKSESRKTPQIDSGDNITEIDNLISLTIKNNTINNSENAKTDFKEDYIEMMTKNYLKYFKDNCQSIESLIEWKENKLKEIENEKKIIENAFKIKMDDLNLKKEFKDFLYSKRKIFCDREGTEIKCFAESVLREFESSKDNFKINEELRPILFYDAEKFICTVVEKAQSESLSNLNNSLKKLQSEFDRIIQNFKAYPYSFDVNRDIEILKKDIRLYKLDDKALSDKSNSTIQSRLKEFEELINYLKLTIPALDINLLKCPKCNRTKRLLGFNEENNSYFDKFSLIDADNKDKLNLLIKCTKKPCTFSILCKNLLKHDYQFEMNKQGEIISISNYNL